MSVPTNWNAADARLLDTNILLYAYDTREPAKRPVARALLSSLLRANNLCLTVQIVNEFFWNATRAGRKGDPPILPVTAATHVLQRWCSVVPILPLGQETTFAAIEVMSAHALSFWDALVWASAKQNGVPTIYTEDYQHGRVVEGVRYINPFLPAPTP